MKSPHKIAWERKLFRDNIKRFFTFKGRVKSVSPYKPCKRKKL